MVQAQPLEPTSGLRGSNLEHSARSQASGLHMLELLSRRAMFFLTFVFVLTL